MENKGKTLIVIGGGAAGFFCAVNAAKNNPTLNVIITEKSSKLLSKVKVSGGGRCNVTHHCFGIEELIKKYPRGQHFLKKAFHHFNTAHTIQWFEERGITLKAEADGRMFPQSNTSQTIIDCLLKEANKYNVEIIMNADVKQISKVNFVFQLQLAGGRHLLADYVCVACGGFSKPEHFQWLQQLGHSFESAVPSLFTFNMPGNSITALMGVSVEQAIVKITGTKLLQEGPVLITHWGLSGPAVLKLSAYAARELAQEGYNFSILINWLPQYNEQTLKTKWQLLRNQLATQAIGSKNPFHLAARLWQYFLQQAAIPVETRWSAITAKQQNKLIQTLVAQSFEVKGKTTFKEEFVTCGGIKLSEINASTMQSRIVSNLFFAGEIMDVDGITGGFNFQHAWTSGWIAAKAIAEVL
ncbi:NAD(P)/FAD-dependent oxidoreductase [Ilyomonas limi]|uniref:NAD(P)/FAD-dependent oxidoreductase n=1 Tax=Ilyomonas limi TaxID=2575867 RepID=A0A4U3L4X0_9BACT|nr:NAD(P)/FAD-dependent oxidoreductase [Ilyomonas limi]TKK69374.1 NAD(P)/FAD-dependent oxidoreductase [Ilyomonas limi]